MKKLIIFEYDLFKATKNSAYKLILVTLFSTNVFYCNKAYFVFKVSVRPFPAWS